MPETKVEAILDRIEEFVNRIDEDDAKKFLNRVLRVTKIVFRFIPMTKDQKELFKAIVEGVEELLKGL